MEKQFKILVVDDQFYCEVADLLCKNCFFKYKNKEGCKPGRPSSINTQLTDGLLIRVARRKNSPRNAIHRKIFDDDNVGAFEILDEENFDIFVLDVDLSDTHNGEANAVGYGFSIWREAVNKAVTKYRKDIKPRLYIIYTRSPRVLEVCADLCYSPSMPEVKTSPLIIIFGSKTIEKDKTFKANDKEVDLLSREIEQFIKDRAREICKGIKQEQKCKLRYLLDNIINKWDIGSYQKLKALPLGDWKVETLFPKQILSIGFEISLCNGNVDEDANSRIRKFLFDIQHIAFSSYGEIIFELLCVTCFKLYPNTAIRKKMEADKEQGKVDHYITKVTDSTSNIWKSIFDELKDKFLQKLKNARLISHSDKLINFFENISDLEGLKKFILDEKDYLAWIRNFYEMSQINTNSFCISKGDIQLLETILNANLCHNPKPVNRLERKYCNSTSDHQGYGGFEYKVSDITNDWNYEQTLEKVKLGLDKPFVSEHLSEMRTIICGYYTGIVEFVTPCGGVVQHGGKATIDNELETKNSEGIVWRFWLPQQEVIGD